MLLPASTTWDIVKKLLVVVLALVIVNLGFVGCGETEPPDQTPIPSTDPGDDDGDDDDEVVDPGEVFKVEIASGAWTGLLHKDTAAGNDTAIACEIDPETHTAAADKYIECIFETQELSTYLLDMNLTYSVPPQMCEHFAFTNYWFINHDLGSADSGVYLRTLQDSNGDDTGNYECGTTGHNEFACTRSRSAAIAAGNTWYVDGEGDPQCVFDHKQYNDDFPNCCYGDYSYVTENYRDVDAAAQVETVLTVADVGASLEGQGLLFYDDVGTVAFWIDVDNDGPGIPGWAGAANRAVSVTTILTGDPDTTVALKLAAAITADSKYSVDPPGGNSFTVTHDPAGTRTAGGADGAAAGFLVSIDTVGAAATQVAESPNVSDESWGDYPEQQCYGGSAARSGEWTRSREHIPLIRYTADTLTNGFVDDFTIMSPISLAGNEFNVNTANYWDPTGTIPNPIAKGYTNSLGQQPFGASGGPEQNYLFRCLDEAGEVRYSIKLKIREWDTSAAYETYLVTGAEDGSWDLDPSASAGSPTQLEGTGCAYESPDSNNCNDNFSWDDFMIMCDTPAVGSTCVREGAPYNNNPFDVHYPRTFW